MSEAPWEIDCRSVKQKLNAGDDFVLLDCRETDEFAMANIAGAKLLRQSRNSSIAFCIPASRSRPTKVTSVWLSA